MKISSTVFKSGEKNIKGSNVCCGNIKILNTELLVEGKISKYQTQYSKVAGKISNAICIIMAGVGYFCFFL